MEQGVLAQQSMDDAFPGFEDLQNHLESRQESPGFDGKLMEHPPGLALGELTFSLEAKYVAPEATENEEARAASSVATAQAVAAILQAQKQLSLERSAGDPGTTVESAMLAEVVRKAIGSLRNSSGPLDGQCSGLDGDVVEPDAPKQPSRVVTRPAAPPPGLRTELRSSARPFHCSFTQPSHLSEQPKGRGVPKPIVSLESALPTQLPALPAMDNIRTHLAQLQGKDPRCVLIVRRIQRLGHDARQKLKDFFEWYGPVESVLVSPSHARSSGPRTALVRLRPAHVGFVVMGTIEGALAALADGESHNVVGVQIEVQKFVPQNIREWCQ